MPVVVIRKRCGKDFQIGVRVSPERFGQDVGEIRDLAQQLVDEGMVDYLRKEGLGEGFTSFLATWPNMVKDYVVPPDVPRFDAEEFFKTGRSVKLAGLAATR